MAIKVKDPDTEQIILPEIDDLEPTPEETIDTRLELIKYSTEVQSKIRDEITSDFTLCKLTEKDKEGIKEMTVDAYFCKKLANTIKLTAHKYDWDNKQQKWIKRHLNKEERQKMTELSHNIFSAFMTRIYMTAILNRNVSENHLIKLLAGLSELDKQETIEKEQSTWEKLKEKIQGLKKTSSEE